MIIGKFVRGLLFLALSSACLVSHADGREARTREKLFVRLEYSSEREWSAWVYGRTEQAHSVKEFAAAMIREAESLKQAGRDAKNVHVSIGGLKARGVPADLTRQLIKAAEDAGFGEASCVTLADVPDDLIVIGGGPAPKEVAPQIDGPLTRFGPSIVMCMRAVVLCDGSKAAGGSVEWIKTDGKHFLERLKPVQSFSMICYRDGKATATADALELALPDRKKKALEFVEGLEAAGNADPTAGLKAAFAAQPQVIFWVCSGDWGEMDVEKLVRELNKDRKVRVNVLGVAGDNAKVNAVLERIAEENGGLFQRYDRIKR